MLQWLEDELGYDIVLWFQSWRTDWVSLIFKPFDLIGTELFFIAALGMIYWTIDKRKGRSISLFFLITVWVNAFCKGLFKRDRPFNHPVQGKEPIIPAFEGPNSYGLPSGHTMSTTSFFSLGVIKFKSILFRIFAVALMILVPMSRLVHGMHYPQDIVLGFMLSFVLLLIFMLLEKRLGKLIIQYEWKVVAPILLVASAFIFSIPFLFKFENESLSDPLVLGVLTISAVLGFFIEYKYIRFKIHTSIIRRILSFIVAMAVLVAIKVGLDFAIAPLEGNFLVHLIMDMIEGILIALWLTAGAPILFIVSGLAERERNHDRKN